MNILIKVDTKSVTGVRGQLTFVDEFEGQPYLFISHISEMGIELLKSHKAVKVEVLGMPSRVVFLAEIKRMLGAGIRVALPKKIISIERRQANRLNTTTNYMAYARIKDWTPKVFDLAAPPAITPFEYLASWMLLSDVSTGGACILTSFPSVINEINTRETPLDGYLMLPMTVPLPFQFHLRWRKKTTNRLVDDGVELARLEYRLGIEFSDPSEQMVVKIRQFMRQLSMAKAI